MSLNTFSYLLAQYHIVAVDEYLDKPERIYLSTSEFQLSEMTKVILIDLVNKVAFEPQLAGSYAKFMCPIRSIDLHRDDIEAIQNRINNLPDLIKIRISSIMEERKEIKDDGYRSFYDLNEYLFNDLNTKFREKGSLDAFDFFCIIIWKANRVKSTIAKNLLKKFKTLEDAAQTITSTLRNENISDYTRFEYLLDNGFRLPMLSAILTVLYPERFLVYDYRICEHPAMVSFQNLANGMTDSKCYFQRYQDYIAAIAEIPPLWMTLRQKDQYLWGKSFANQLKNDIKNNFNK